MRELKPYRTLHGMQAAIDNGGRFYNLPEKSFVVVVIRGPLEQIESEPADAGGISANHHCG
jgi:hypothetical protein